MKKNFLPLLIISSLSFFSCQKEKIVTSSRSSSSSQPGNVQSTPPVRTINFTGSYTTTISLQGSTGLQINGSGSATILGQSVFVAFATISIDRTGQSSMTGNGMFTASNGDKFYTQFTGSNILAGNNINRIATNHTIISGTGMFANATGDFTGITTAPANSTTNSASFEGFINY